MSKLTEFNNWLDAKYPYDMADCGNCATVHASVECHMHPEMSRVAKEEYGFTAKTQREITPIVKKRILAFRRRFAKFYNRGDK